MVAMMSWCHDVMVGLGLPRPVSNLSPVFGPSIKRKIGIREAIT